ncbi:Alpha/Beta hydrolase protein [Cyathus striatus]|nr:Alpha/Beta hydrolase protein [Cyathus striatus]
MTGPLSLRSTILRSLPRQETRTSDGSLVILHGLFEKFAEKMGMPVYALDLRNQGHSPHIRPMTYPHMASDHKLSQITLMGHSMGGKAAMTTALQSPPSSNLIKNLIVVDIAPAKGKISSEFRGYVDAMRKIEAEGLKSKREALDFLERYERDVSIRHFLLTNLLPLTPANPTCKFRVPLDILHESVPDIGDFPYESGECIFKGPTLFVKGSKSRYINKHNMHTLEEFFPARWVKTLDTGHWGAFSFFLAWLLLMSFGGIVHAEK